MPRQILPQTVPGSDGERLHSIQMVIFILRIVQPSFRVELVWMLEVGLQPVSTQLMHSDNSVSRYLLQVSKPDFSRRVAETVEDMLINYKGPKPFQKLGLHLQKPLKVSCKMVQVR